MSAMQLKTREEILKSSVLQEASDLVAAPKQAA